VQKAKPLISVVDDDESMREAVKGLMKSLGYRVEAAASAEEFLGSRHVRRTSCLIADVQMPGINRVRAVSAPVGFRKAHSNHPDHGVS
jgi:FixJ family two-component response regulator